MPSCVFSHWLQERVVERSSCWLGKYSAQLLNHAGKILIEVANHISSLCAYAQEKDQNTCECRTDYTLQTESDEWRKMTCAGCGRAAISPTRVQFRRMSVNRQSAAPKACCTTRALKFFILAFLANRSCHSQMR